MKSKFFLLARGLFLIIVLLFQYSCIQLPNAGGDGQPCNSAGICMPGYECKADICIKSQNPGDGGSADGYWIDQTTGYWWENPPSENNKVWQDAKDYCDDLILGGQTDWWLPSISELRSLVRGCVATQTGGSCGVTDVCLADSCLNPSCQSCNGALGPGKDGCYWEASLFGSCYSAAFWSSSSFASDPSYAFTVSFDQGGLDGYIKAQAFNSARCMRVGNSGYDGGSDASYDGGTAYSEWIDLTTGYWWQDPAAETVMTWQEAITYCENLVLVGESDWRLPSISELRSLIRGCDLRSSAAYCDVSDSCLDSSACWSPTTCMHCYGGGTGPGKNGCFWDPTLSGDCSQHPWYWSSSTVANSSGSAWAVIFSSGYVRYDVKTPAYSVRCVRGP